MTTDRQNNPFAFQIGQNSFTMRDLQAPHVRSGQCRAKTHAAEDIQP